jgi:hypothetical protein
MTPINITLYTPAQKKILEFLIKERIRVNDRCIRVNKDTILADYYNKQQQDLDYLFNQLNK